MTTKEGSTQIINFMTSGAGVLAKCKSYSENTLFLKKKNLYSHAYIKQTTGKYIVMMTKEGSYKIVTFMTLGQGFLS